MIDKKAGLLLGFVAGLIFAALLCVILDAPDGSVDARTIYPVSTIAALPDCNGMIRGAVVFVTDATSSMDCSTGGGTYIATCACASGSAWETLTQKPAEPCRRDGNEIVCDGPPDEIWFDGIRIK